MKLQKRIWLYGVLSLCFVVIAAVILGIGMLRPFSAFAADTERNVALSASVSTASDWEDPEGAWRSRFITDGSKMASWPLPEGETLGWRSIRSASRETNITLTVDLGDTARINRVELYPRGNGGICFPDDYAIDISTDGVAWTRVASVTGDTTVKEEGRTLSFAEQNARYVRLTVTRLSEERDGNDYVCEISEIEVWGVMEEVITLNKSELWIRIGGKDRLAAMVGGIESTENITFSSADSSVVIVDGKGNVTAVATGETTITCTNTANGARGVCKVKVLPEKEENIQITVPVWDNELCFTEEQFRWLQEANVDVAMMVGAPYLTPTDRGDQALRIARSIYDESLENNLEVMLFGHQHGINVHSSEEELRAFAEKYRNTPLMAGYHIEDEPRDVNPFARVTKTLREYDPNSIADVNFLPGFVYGDSGENYGKGSEYYGRLTDYAKLCGEGNTFLSFDNYPFTPQKDSVNEYDLFGNFETLRQASLETGAPTCVYLQAVGSSNFNYRRPDENVLRYHMASALSYGFTWIKYYSWYVPGTLKPGSNEHEYYTSAIMDVNGNKTEMYDVAKELNRQVHNVGDILVHLTAKEVYHTSDGPYGVYKKIPQNFFAQVNGNGDVILSLMVNEKTGESYLMVVNKDFMEEQTISLNLSGVRSLVEIDKTVDDGTLTPSYTGGVLTRTFAPGEFALYKLSDGEYATESEKGADNLLLGAKATANDSLGRDGYYIVNVNNGERTATKVNKGWMFEANSTVDGWLQFDLGASKQFNRLDLYPVGEGVACGNLFPSKMQILVSDDKKTWREVYTNEAIDAVTEEVPVFKFAAATGRYVKLLFPDCIGVALAEAELYMDEGNIPTPPPTSYEKPTISKGENLAAGKTVSVSGQYSDVVWNSAFATDGHKMQSYDPNMEGTLGWCAGFFTSPEQTAWIRVDLGTRYPIDRIHLYPRGDGGVAFPVDYKVQVSADGASWIDVATVVNGETNVVKERVFTFDTVMAKYVRVYVTKFSEETANNYSCEISEIEVYGDGIPALNEKINSLPTRITVSNYETTKQTVAELREMAKNESLRTFMDLDSLTALEEKLAAYERVKPVIDQIAALPLTINDMNYEEGKAATLAARAAYDALSDTEKEAVSNHVRLGLVEKSLASYEKPMVDGAALDEKIAALPDEITADNYGSTKESVAALQAEYEGLSDKAKAFVTKTERLQAVKEALQAYEDELEKLPPDSSSDATSSSDSLENSGVEPDSSSSGKTNGGSGCNSFAMGGAGFLFVGATLAALKRRREE